jgi:hypothetical protein
MAELDGISSSPWTRPRPGNGSRVWPNWTKAGANSRSGSHWRHHGGRSASWLDPARRGAAALVLRVPRNEAELARSPELPGHPPQQQATSSAIVALAPARLPPLPVRQRPDPNNNGSCGGWASSREAATRRARSPRAATSNAGGGRAQQPRSRQRQA